MRRRSFVAVAGGGIVVAATAVTGGFALTRTPKQALLPWAEAGSLYTESRRRALSYAILAPNPHNRQPWLVDLSLPGQVRVFVDRTKLLPATDPFSRQITIGLGCFLELMRMAAAEDGYRVDTVPFPEGAAPSGFDDRPVAVATFVKDDSVVRQPLFAHVFDRRSLKEPFDTSRDVPDDVLSELVRRADVQSTVGVTNRPAEVDALRALTVEALDLEIRTPHTFKESVDLFRIGKAEVNANPDGIDFSGVMFETLGAVGYFTREAALDPSTAAYQQGYEAVIANCETAMGHVWLNTPTNTRLDQLTAGRDWLRVNLAGTALGLGTQPLSQALQEYAEMAALYARVHELLAPDGGTVQMLARLGYGPQVPPSPRWRLEEKLVKT